MADDRTEQYPVPPPLVYQSLYPCQACHQKDIRGLNSRLGEGNAFLGTYLHLPNPQPRVLVRMHRDINLQILCFDTNGDFKFAWGHYGKAPGEFKYPGPACVDQKGNLFVVDILNGRIQVFDPDGKHSRQLGRLGIVPGRLFRPKGIVVDPQSRIFVSDSYTGIVQVFNRTGGLHGILSRGPSQWLRLTGPIGMAFDKGGRFYVVQAHLNMVSVYRIIGR